MKFVTPFAVAALMAVQSQAVTLSNEKDDIADEVFLDLMVAKD